MAYKMLIAEDEQEEYELVLFLLEKLGLLSSLRIYHAENGKQALKILEETPVELLLTDIEMPFANGLEIAAKARAQNPCLPIIFFSCYDNFSYIKTALTVQADNYLLKPLDPEEFEKTIRHAFDQLRQNELLRKIKDNHEQELKNHYLYQKLNRMPCQEPPDMEAFGGEGPYTRLVLLHFEEAFFDCEPKASEDFLRFLQELFPIPFDAVNLNASQSALLFRGKKEDAPAMERFAELCGRSREKIEEAFRAKCYFAVSSLLSEGAGLPDAYEDACSLLETRFFCRDQYVFYKQSMASASPESSELCSDILASAEADMDAGNMDRLTEDILRLNRILEQSSNYSHIYVRYIYSSLIQILYKNSDAAEMPEDIERIFSCSFIHEIEEIVFAVLARLQTERNAAASSRKYVIRLARQYIHKHYSGPISLNDIAGAVYLNPSYLSTVFKMETGSSINKYIKSVRMEKARQLLTRTNRKVSDVGEAVGFSNTSYFIRSFHEYFGETPEKMRQKQLTDDVRTDGEERL